MLNELQKLRNSLKANGIQAAAWHPAIKPLAKYATLLVRLNEQGIPASVGELPRDQACGLRNIQPDNQNSFPAFNLNCPVFQAPAAMDLWSPLITAPPETVQTLSLAYEGRNGKVPALDRLRRLLREYPAQEIAPKLSASAEDPVLASTLHLLELLKTGKQSSEEFLRSFAVALIAASQHGTLGSEQALEVLFGKLSKKGTREPWQCILYLDLENLNRFDTAVADPDSAAAWSEALLLPVDQRAQENVVQCALDGHSGPAIGDKMPNPNLPLLGGTYLFSMNSEIPCQSRYGQSSTSLFPVTRHAVQGLNDALLHMTAKAAEGRTWSRLPSGTGDKLDLLIAYIEEAPELDAPVAATMAAGSADKDEEDDDDEQDAEARKKAYSSAQMSSFVERLKRLHEAVQLKEGEAIRGRHLRLFVLSTIDKGRKQVLFDARYNVGNLAEARDRWVAGADNAPALELQFFQGKGKPKKKWRGVRAPSPVELAYSFRTLWIRGAERSEKVSGVSLGRLYKLLLDPDEKEAAALLERFLPLKVDLMIAAGKPARSERTGEVFVYTGALLSAPALYDLRTSAATLGILLYLLGHNKEDYMKDRDYLLGQFLQFADRLHLFYCKGVRGGQIPPQLLGNAYVAMMAQSPKRALDVMTERMPIYKAYATQIANRAAEPETQEGAAADRMQASPEEDKKKPMSPAAEARWLLKQLGQISQAIAQGDLSDGMTITSKAQLLLGYLATPFSTEGK